VSPSERIATQLCSNHISATVNQNATIEQAVFSMGTNPKLYNDDLMQLELESRVEDGSNTSTVTLQDGDEKRSLESEKVIYGHESHGTWTGE
jgi:hypothetical protein